MNNSKKFLNKSKDSILTGIRLLIKAIFIFFLTSICILSLLNIPSVRKKITEYCTSYFSDKTGYKISLREIDFQWLDNINLYDLVIYGKDDKPMISFDHANLNLTISKFYLNNTLNFDYVNLDKPQVNLRFFESDSINIKKFSYDIAKAFSSPNNNEKIQTIHNKFNLSVPVINVKNGKFTYYDDDEPEMDKSDFDYYHINFENVNADVYDFNVSADTLLLTVKHLDLTTPNKDLFVKDLTTKFTFTYHQMTFEKLLLKTNKSIVGNYMKLEYNDIPDLVQFNTHTTISTNIENSTIDTSELKYFFNYFDDKNTSFNISGQSKGKVNDFEMKNVYLNLSEKSRFILNGEVKGLPEYKETKLNIKVDSFALKTSDFVNILNDENIEKISVLNKISGKGAYIRTPKTKNATFQLNTSLGFIDIVLNYNHKTSEKKIVMDGTLDVLDFDLQKFLNIEMPLKDVDFYTNFKVIYKDDKTIFDSKDITTKIQIDSLDIFKNKFKNISLNTSYGNNGLHVFVNSKDKKMMAKGSTLLKFDSLVHSEWDYTFFDASLALTQFFSKNESIEGSVKADIYGNNIEHLTGIIDFKQMILKKKNQRIDIGNTHLSYKSNVNRNKNLIIQSSLLDFNSNGVFDLGQLQHHFYQSLEEYKRLFQNDDVNNKKYYDKKTDKIENVNVNFSLVINEINPFFEFTNTPIRINKNASFGGNIIVTNTTSFSIHGKIDSLLINTTKFINNEFDFSTSKFNSNSEVLSTLNLFSKNQLYNNQYINSTDSINLFFIWANNKLEFETRVKQKESNSQYYIQGTAIKENTNVEVNIKNSIISVMGEDWKTNNKHKIVIGNNSINFENLVLENKIKNKNKQQKLVISGKYGDNPINPLYIDIINIEVTPFGKLLNQKIIGTLNSKISISKQKFLNNIDVDFSINDSSWSNYNIGNILGSISTPTLEGHNVRCTFRKNKQDYAFVYGSYQPFQEVPIDITIVGNDIPLDILQSSFADVITDLEGDLSGELNINASFDYIDINGDGKIKNGKGTIEYLKTETTFSGDIIINNNMIGMDSLRVQDINQNFAIIKGGFKHQNFNDFELDLNGYFNDFIVFNANKKDNDYFYGRGRGTGTILIQGPLSNFKIFTNIKTENGTKVKIPIIGDDIEYNQDFIKFVSNNSSNNKTINITESNAVKNNVGFDFEMDLEVTSDASLEVILSETSRDYVKGKSKGNLNLKINKNNELTLNGEIEAIDGEYSFTIQKLFNKKFNILPNSTVKWTGDPYNGTINVKAQYPQLASLEPLFDEATSQVNPDISRKYNTDVILNLTGNLQQPNIDFNIEFDKYPISLLNEIEEVKSRILADKQERERQAFSLIALYKFSPYNNFSLSLASQIGGSFSEIISNQFSHWMSQVDENLEIDINLGKLDQNAFNDLQLRMSYVLFDGRMVVTRDGGVTDGQNITNFNSIAGDWSVDYLVYPSGKLKVKMYKKNNYNSISTIINNNISTGVSIIYTKNFHELKEIWQKSRDKHIKKNQK